jgi:hypothetical protein
MASQKPDSIPARQGVTRNADCAIACQKQSKNKEGAITLNDDRPLFYVYPSAELNGVGHSGFPGENCHPQNPPTPSTP